MFKYERIDFNIKHQQKLYFKHIHAAHVSCVYSKNLCDLLASFRSEHITVVLYFYNIFTFQWTSVTQVILCGDCFPTALKGTLHTGNWRGGTRKCSLICNPHCDAGLGVLHLCLRRACCVKMRELKLPCRVASWWFSYGQVWPSSLRPWYL